MAASNPTHWAVLIGVGVTTSRTMPGSPSSNKDRSLKGAVQDIIAVSEYLKTGHHMIGSAMVDISVLTATKLHQDGAAIPMEAPDCLPSLENVTSSFRRILDLAKPGDHIYIHYSGHGTRRKLDGAVALELVHQNSFATEYMYGTVLRNAISKMIRKELSVTLVLDCCFSGSVLRMDQAETVGIRYIEHDPDIDVNSEYIDPFAESLGDEMRGAVVNLARLLDPKGYTIIAACGPHEVASELEFAGGVRRGALSYFLVDSLATLRRKGMKVSNQMLHQHLRAQFHVCLPEQTPMLYGNRGFSFFGNFTAYPQFSMVSGHRSIEDGHLVLHAGEVHGVHSGDEYALNLSEFPENFTVEGYSAVRGKTSLVDCVTSRLITMEPKDTEKIKKGSVWKATLVTSVSPRKIYMKLDPSVPDRSRLIQAAKTFQFLVLSETGETKEDGVPIFQVVLNAQNAIEMQDHTCKTIHNFGPISKTGDGSLTDTALLNMLGHVAKFKFLEGIENSLPNPSFESSFRLSTDHESGKDGSYAIKHGNKLKLTFQNLTNRPLYLAVFIFNEFWEVRNLVSESGEDTCLPVFPKCGDETGEQELPLVMSVPDELQQRGQKQTDDIVKIFITQHSSMFPGAILPRLGDDAGLRGEMEPLQKLLQQLSGDLRGAENGEACEWTTRIYFIRTYR
jgi:hypothetical protein